MVRDEVTIRNCTFAFKCQANWDLLKKTDVKDIHFCADCQREVHFCAEDVDLIKSIRLNRCVAICKDDSYSEKIFVGKPNGPFDEN